MDHDAGLAGMTPLETLVARSEIQDCLARYARGLDRRDWDSVAACFHVDAVDQHGEFSGGPGEFIDWVRLRHAGVPFSMHYLLNCLIEFEGDDSARVETYFWAIQRREAENQAASDHEVFGRYLDHFAYRNGMWRLAGRRVVYDSTRTTASTHHLRTLAGILGRRDSLDPVYTSGG